jgi:hypothetical protein
MDIAGADAGLADLDADGPGIVEGRDGAVFEGDVLDGAEDEGETRFLGS